MSWKESDPVWLVLFWGSLRLNDDDSLDAKHIVSVACKEPEDAISAVREVHDECAQFFKIWKTDLVIPKEIK